MELTNIKEIILYSENIINNSAIELNNLAQHFGYQSFKDIKCRMDINFINKIKDYLLNNKIDTFNKDIEVKEINTNKKWTIIYDNIYITEKDNHIFKENIAYLNSYQQDYNYIDLGI